MGRFNDDVLDKPSEMVERVARALEKVIEDEFDTLGYVRDEQYRTIAKAAIAAMREPTGLCAAGNITIDADSYHGPLSIICDPADVWVAMIDAALE